MWCQIKNESKIASPGMLFYKERIVENIKRMVQMAGDANRLVPHVKTHKTQEIVLLQMEQGINKFKCATIAEAEMVAAAGGKWILIAYQLIGPNIDRLCQLKQLYPDVYFASLIDDLDAAKALSKICEDSQLEASVFLDVNVGMNRTGATAEFLSTLIDSVSPLPRVELDGLHVYDGHNHISDYHERKQQADQDYQQIESLIDDFQRKIGKEPMIVAGGSPTFNIHVLRPGIFLSPGTNVLWDAGYGENFKDQEFLPAAIIISRVISKPTEGIITLDLGHKAIAAENPIKTRMRILNLDEYEVLSQSEEHGVIRLPISTWNQTKVGDVYYIQPYHICPSVALHEFATVVNEGSGNEEWKIIARNRRITI